MCLCSTTHPSNVSNYTGIMQGRGLFRFFWDLRHLMWLYPSSSRWFFSILWYRWHFAREHGISNFVQCVKRINWLFANMGIAYSCWSHQRSELGLSGSFQVTRVDLKIRWNKRVCHDVVIYTTVATLFPCYALSFCIHVIHYEMSSRREVCLVPAKRL